MMTGSSSPVTSRAPRPPSQATTPDARIEPTASAAISSPSSTPNARASRSALTARCRSERPDTSMTTRPIPATASMANASAVSGRHAIDRERGAEQQRAEGQRRRQPPPRDQRERGRRSHDPADADGRGEQAGRGGSEAEQRDGQHDGQDVERADHERLRRDQADEQRGVPLSGQPRRTLRANGGARWPASSSSSARPGSSGTEIPPTSTAEITTAAAMARNTVPGFDSAISSAASVGPTTKLALSMAPETAFSATSSPVPPPAAARAIPGPAG